VEGVQNLLADSEPLSRMQLGEVLAAEVDGSRSATNGRGVERAAPATNARRLEPLEIPG
jgi:hypothetical protein